MHGCLSISRVVVPDHWTFFKRVAMGQHHTQLLHFKLCPLSPSHQRWVNPPLNVQEARTTLYFTAFWSTLLHALVQPDWVAIILPIQYIVQHMFQVWDAGGSPSRLRWMTLITFSCNMKHYVSWPKMPREETEK